MSLSCRWSPQPPNRKSQLENALPVLLSSFTSPQSPGAGFFAPEVKSILLPGIPFATIVPFTSSPLSASPSSSSLPGRNTTFVPGSMVSVAPFSTTSWPSTFTVPDQRALFARLCAIDGDAKAMESTASAIVVINFILSSR